MSIAQTYIFDNAPDYTLNNAQINVDKAQLTIVDNPNQHFTQDFTSDAGFTYDNTKSEFSGGVVRQKDQTPADSIFGANFNSGADANWGEASLTGTLFTSAAIVGGKLSLPLVDSHIKYTGSANNPTSEGCIRFRYTHKHAGNPPVAGYLLSNNGTSQFYLLFNSNGTFRVTIKNDAGSQAFDFNSSALTWNLDQVYEIELNWSVSGAFANLYRDTVRVGLKSTVSGTRNTTGTELFVGTYSSGVSGLVCEIDDLIIFNSVQNSGATRATGYVVADYRYTGSKVDLPAFSYTGIGTIIAVESSSVTETGTPRYTIAGLWYNGAAWVASNLTYAEANTSAEVIANLTSLNVTGATSIPVSVYFTDANTQSNVDNIDIELTGQKYLSPGYVEPVAPIYIEALDDYDHTAVNTANTQVRVILKLNGVLTWWDGAAWSTSNGLEAESNTAAEVAANATSLNLTENKNLYVRWLLISTANAETPELSDASVVYNFGGVAVEANKCIIYGYVRNMSGVVLEGVTCKFSLNTKSNKYAEANGNVVSTVPVSVLTDVNGYFEIELIRSSEFELPLDYKLEMTIDTSTTITKLGSRPIYFTVPDLETQDITDLITQV